MTKERNTQLVFSLDKEFVVSQDNKLIFSKYDMTALEQKLLLILISTIKKTDKEAPSSLFRVVDLAKLLNVIPEMLYRDLPKICKKIMSRVIEIQADNGNWEMFNIISYAHYTARQGIIQLDIHEKAEPYLLELKECFASYQLKNIINLSSKYSIRIFQLANANKYQREFIMSIEDFKDMLKLVQKSYKEFSNIRIKVLNPAIKEINEKTSLKVNYEPIRTGRRVSGLRFTVEKNDKVKEDDNMLNPKSFNNFKGRDYDYSKLEGYLLGHEEYDEDNNDIYIK